MTISVAAGGSVLFVDGGGTTADTTLNVNSGEYVLVGIVWRGSSGASLSSVTLTGESNATLIGSTYSNTLNHRYRFALLGPATSSGTKTVQVNWDVAPVAGSCFAIVLATTAGPITVDAEDNASGTGTTAAVTLAASAAGDAAFAIAGSAASELTQDTGYTPLNTTNVWNITTAEYNVAVGDAGAKTIQMTASNGVWEIKGLLLTDSEGEVSASHYGPSIPQLAIVT